MLAFEFDASNALHKCSYSIEVIGQLPKCEMFLHNYSF